MSRHPWKQLTDTTVNKNPVGFNKEQVDLFFEKYEQSPTKYSPSSLKIFNCDGTTVSVIHENTRKFLSKGKKQVSKITSGERGKNVTVLYFQLMLLADPFIPPLFVFGREKMSEGLKKNELNQIEVFLVVKKVGGSLQTHFWPGLNGLFLESTILDGHSSHK